jgi:hypothetical protein
MIIKVQISIMPEDGVTEIVEEVARIEREKFSPAELGLNLGEAKTILSGLQRSMVTQQAAEFVAKESCCLQCDKEFRHNGRHKIAVRTLFGKMQIESPRFYRCRCGGAKRNSFSPLATALPERTSAELLYLETKWAFRSSYGMTLKMLGEVLPIAQDINTTAIRKNVVRLGERIDRELGKEQGVFIEGCQRDWENLPVPEGPLSVGIDGGYVHSCEQEKKGEGGCFEIIVGKSIPTDGKGKCFGFVNCYDKKPKRRMFEVLTSQGLQINQQITFLSDGGDTVRDLQMLMSPQAEHILDWFHVSMRLQVLNQMAKGLKAVAKAQIAPIPVGGDEKDDPLDAEKLEKKVERLKWNLWHGNVHRALELIRDLEWDLEAFSESSEKVRKMEKAVGGFDSYIRANRQFIPNYGDRWRNKERISTGFVESTVNQVISKRMVKKQQMRWSKRGAHLMLQIRPRVLNDEWGATLARWYPGMKLDTEAFAA